MPGNSRVGINFTPLEKATDPNAMQWLSKNHLFPESLAGDMNTLAGHQNDLRNLG
jgi:hypothetical protein